MDTYVQECTFQVIYASTYNFLSAFSIPFRNISLRHKAEKNVLTVVVVKNFHLSLPQPCLVCVNHLDNRLGPCYQVGSLTCRYWWAHKDTGRTSLLAFQYLKRNVCVTYAHMCPIILQ